MLQAQGRAHSDAQNNEVAQKMTQQTQERIATETDGFGAACQTPGCGEYLGWHETQQEAEDARYEHELYHARGGQQAITEIYPERGVKTVVE